MYVPTYLRRYLDEKFLDNLEVQIVLPQRIPSCVCVCIMYAQPVCRVRGEGSCGSLHVHSELLIY